MTADPIADYHDAIRARLPASSRRSRRILLEIEQHLRERAAGLAAAGLEPNEAAREAVLRFGPVDEIITRFALEAPVLAGVHLLMAAATTVTILGTALLAVATIVFAAILPHPGALARVAAMGLSAIVLVHGWSTLRLLWSDRIAGETRRLLITITGVALAALGAAVTVWSVHLALATHDWEGYALLRGVLIALQGALSVIAAFPRVRSQRSDVTSTV